MKIQKTLTLCFSAILLTSAAVSAAPTQKDDYPNRPIRLLVGYSPSGAADLIARVFGEALSRNLKQTVIVENRPGAGSTLASRALARSDADGYTLGLATATLFGIDQYLYKVDYTPADFTPLMRLTVSPLILAVNNDINVSTVPELMEKAKKNPGTLNFSSSGIGGSPHVAGSMFEKSVGVPMTHVPYKGGAPALQAVAAGTVQFSFGTASSVLPLVHSGKIRALGVSSSEVSAVAPDLKPLANLGLPGFDYTFWFGLFGPADLPESVQTKLLDATHKTLNDPKVKASLLASGNEVSPFATQAEFKDWAEEYGEFVLERVKEAGIKVQ
ncbi:tripartite tricarboxylate transporter substrate binding protein [Pusillimonas sp. ANT_WB101]|uniref:Bug family tripartite tricarboxylate transporter substrate binding protein n=1 Tax=Pusillimonas sp. ANT_WB101 TaxID=2597356 RepID=UPI0011EC703B|nr:tripartite tricarboxylate transporter substrate binding protein [Pusillimonas sp. ANT_WB101]KAA0910436.1 tripartite tricarboxylate transporter substrate binding protein [Pusillimonas sp. ANT_WB101]